MQIVHHRVVPRGVRKRDLRRFVIDLALGALLVEFGAVDEVLRLSEQSLQREGVIRAERSKRAIITAQLDLHGAATSQLIQW
jgi:hypothetical protein